MMSKELEVEALGGGEKVGASEMTTGAEETAESVSQSSTILRLIITHRHRRDQGHWCSKP